MGMTACYMEAERNLIEKLKNTDEDLFDEIETLAEQNIKMYDMDKLWDGLHFILTGVSATAPIENNLLSEAIVGTPCFQMMNRQILLRIFILKELVKYHLHSMNLI